MTDLKGDGVGNVARSDEANPRPICGYFAPAQRGGGDGENVQLCALFGAADAGEMG